MYSTATLGSVFCIMTTAVSSTFIRRQSLKGSPGESALIRSSGFPSPYTGAKIYEYKLENRNMGSVIIHAIDFQLHSLSSLKVYDGHSPSDPHRSYFGLDRPVFQSSGRKLMLVFKTGDIKKNSYIGFRIKYKYVSYTRSAGYISSLPAIGLCGQRTMLQDKKGLVIVQGSHLSAEQMAPGDPGLYYISCLWLLQPDSDLEYITVKIVNTSLSSGETGEFLRIGTGQISALKENQLAEYIRLQRSSGPHVFRARSIYVYLNMHMDSEDILQFEYYTDKVKNLEPTPVLPANPCKFKTCNISNTVQTCKMYWQRCRSKVDVSCEVPHPVRVCKKQDSCFTAWDMCDSYSDCGSKDVTDENSCKCSKSKKLAVKRDRDMMADVTAPEAFLLGTFSSNQHKQCQSACQKEPTCSIFTVYTDSGQCYGRFNFTVTERFNQEAISGYRNCVQEEDEECGFFLLCPSTWRSIGYFILVVVALAVAYSVLKHGCKKIDKAVSGCCECAGDCVGAVGRLLCVTLPENIRKLFASESPTTQTGSAEVTPTSNQNSGSVVHSRRSSGISEITSIASNNPSTRPISPAEVTPEVVPCVPLPPGAPPPSYELAGNFPSTQPPSYSAALAMECSPSDQHRKSSVSLEVGGSSKT